MRRAERGFTLMEVLIALAITAVIGTVIASTLSETVSFSWSANKHMEAIKQVENAIYRINRDVQVASGVSTSTPGAWLVITLPDGNSINYTIVNPGNNSPDYLQRTQGGASESVARYIDTAPGLTACSYSGGLLSVQITVTVGGFKSASETRMMTMFPRLNQSGN